MSKRLNYILLMTFFLAAQMVAQAQPVIDKVCKDAVRTYRVDGETGLSYTWILKDHLGNPVSISSGAPFTDTDGSGNLIEGGEITIAWSFVAGTYSLSVEKQSIYKCSVVELGTIEVIPLPKFQVFNPPVVCEGESVNLGAFTVTAGSDPGLALTYWNDGSASSPLTNYTAITTGGIYYIKADNGTECPPVVLPVTVTIRQKSTPHFSLNSLICFNSSALVLPTTSNDGINGTWNPSVVSTSVLGEKTTYEFTPALGECAVPTNIEITVADNITPIFAAIGPFCVGESPMSLPLTSTNNITGKWSPTMISTMTAGAYVYTFTPDAAGQCSNPIDISVTISDPVTPTFTPIAPICQNSLANPLPATSIEGISGTWSPAFSSAAVGPTTYTFTPDAGQCAKTTSVAITVTPSIPVTFDPIGPFCFGAPAPALSTTSKEGVSGTWSPAVVDMSQTRTYTFIAATGCTNPFSMPIVINRLDLTATQVDLGYSTLPIGSIDLTVSGGSGSYSYLWDNGATTQDISGLADGDYKVTVTDLVTNCSKMQTISITKLINDLALTTDFTPPLCPGSNDATATVTPSGGKAPYTYYWNNLQTSPIATGLIAGVYSVTVTDAKGITRGAIITIPETAVKFVIASASPVDPVCFGENGNIELIFGSIGIVPNDNYDILYDGGQFAAVAIAGNRATISAPPGTYTNIRVEIRGCITNAVGPVKIAPAPPALTLPTIAIVQPDCDILTGTIRIIAPIPNGGINYTVKGTNPVVLAQTNATGIFPGLSAGVYDLTYTDTKGCTSAPVSAVIDAQPVTPDSPIAIPVLAECEKRPIQSLNANSGIAPPTAGITIIWYDSAVGGNVISPIWSKTGSATFYAEATNGKCTNENRTPVTLTINPTPAPPISKGNLSACESSTLVTLDARDAIDATGKNIVWYDALVGGNVVASPTLNAIKTVTYYAEDVSGVCASFPRTAVSLTIFSMPGKPTAVVSVVPRCVDTSGVIEVTAPIGPNFVYNIDNGPYQTSATFTNQTPGDHSLRVKNKLVACESAATVVKVPDIPPVPKITKLTVENCICYGDSGKLNFEFENIVDGTYVIIYLGGQFENVKLKGNKASVLAKAGTYNVLAIQANGCTSIENWNVEIKQPDQITVSAKITEIDLKSKQKGEIDLTINGGTGAYKTIWKPNPITGFAGATTEDIKNLDAGIYVVTVTDASGCFRTFIDTIPKANVPPMATDDVFNADCNLITGDLLYTNNGNGVDSDSDGDPIAIDIIPVKTPSHGTLTIKPDGTFEYTALQGYTGDDSFRYVIYDIKKNSSNPATVTIHVVSDTDRDGIADDLDPDADGDGILNVDELTAGQDWKKTDSDGDGRPNYLDIDSDNDGIVDNIEAQSTPGYIKPSGIDKDHNGIDDAYDPGQGGVAIIPVDTDGDGIPDFLDVDSDGDGVPDYIEGHDLNADGKPDLVSVGKDSDGDGLDDGFDTVVNGCSPTENVIGSDAAMLDFDGDGLKDWRDENDDDDQYLTRFEDLNGDGDFSNDTFGHPGHPEYLWVGRDCDLFIPNAFSPNGDNIHDYFQIYCTDDYPNAKLYIFDQLGNKLYEKEHYGNLTFWGSYDQAWWDGRTTNRAAITTEGGKVAPGTYYYVLQLGNGDVKKSFIFVSY